MAPKNPFKRKPTGSKDKVVLKKADKNTTEISVTRVERTKVSPAPLPSPQWNETAFMDVPTLQHLLKQRDEQIASLKNQVAELQSTVNDLEAKSNACSCGAYERQTSGPKLNSHFSKW